MPILTRHVEPARLRSSYRTAIHGVLCLIFLLSAVAWCSAFARRLADAEQRALDHERQRQIDRLDDDLREVWREINPRRVELVPF